MITREILNDNTDSYAEERTLDLVDALRWHIRHDRQPPVDLVAMLEERGENVDALSVEIMRGR